MLTIPNRMPCWRSAPRHSRSPGIGQTGLARASYSSASRSNCSLCQVLGSSTPRRASSPNTSRQTSTISTSGHSIPAPCNSAWDLWIASKKCSIPGPTGPFGLTPRQANAPARADSEAERREVPTSPLALMNSVPYRSNRTARIPVKLASNGGWPEGIGSIGR